MIADAAITSAKKCGKVRVTIKVGPDLDLSVAAVAGTHIGVRGEIKPEA